MRASVFVPGHISCIFRPVRHADVLSTGSLGLGIRLGLGCHADVSIRDDSRIRISINGSESEASVTRYALELMELDTGLDVALRHDLPLEQGFGASASGTYAATLCAASLAGQDLSDAAKATHIAECEKGGGLGDLLAIESPYDVPLRTHPGCPATVGRTEDTGLRFDSLTMGVFDDPLRTASVLGDEDSVSRIIGAGDSALRMFTSDMSMDNLFRASNMFSEGAELESGEIRDALRAIRGEGYRAGMCMLGNSVFSDASAEVMDGLFDRVYACGSYSGRPEVTRTA